MDQLGKNSKIRPIQFRVLSEDEATNLNADHKVSSPFQEQIFQGSQNLYLDSTLKNIEKSLGKNKSKKNRLEKKQIDSNFSLEFSYPAVIFSKVDFNINQKRRRGNLIGELIDSLGFTGKNEKIQILKSIDLQVPYGSIFGLLGPSSCGKTTLLRCLVGLLEPSEGSIRLFGHESRSKQCQVPGKNIGYMPQDLGLYEDFTIRQILIMFGRYMNMDPDLVKSRIEFMSSFLELPDVDRKIFTLSGGQKRRVSFAIACIHMPPLIILDEPTVGVDPLLRQSIWKYLRKLARDENKTIIITTHYIEEAAQADQVALMRAGEILVQDTPSRIMEKCGSSTLEGAFLSICNDIQVNSEDKGKRVSDNDNKLSLRKRQTNDILACSTNIQTKQASALSRVAQTTALDNLSFRSQPDAQQHQQQQHNQSKLSNKNTSQSHESLSETYKGMRVRPESQEILTVGNRSTGQRGKLISIGKYWQAFLVSMNLMYAIMYKNYRRNLNSIPLVAFQFILPIIQMVSFSLCVGGRPSNIGIGLVNRDQLPILENRTGSEDGYDFGNQLLSEKFLEFVDPSVITLKPYSNLTSALADVRRAKLWAAMEFSENFTISFQQRFDSDNFYQLEKSTIDQSVVKLYPDRSNKILDMICIRILVQSFRDFLGSQFEHFKKLPIEVKEPVFEIKPNLISNSLDGYTESIAAGLLVSLTYIMAAGLTTFIMVVERSGGILERTYTSGINPVLYLLAHATFRSIMMMVQISVVMFLTFYLLRQPLEGSITLSFLMLIVINITGISYGLLVSSIVSDQNGAALAIVSSLVIKITMSGILWPIEAIPRFLRPLCYSLPLTLPIKALRGITLKGADLTDRWVQLGFLVSLGWTIVFLTISARRFKFYQH